MPNNESNTTTTTPTRFYYYDNQDSRLSKNLKLYFKILFKTKNVEPSNELIEYYKDKLLESDKLADNLVDETFNNLEPGEGRKLFDQACLHGVSTLSSPPQALLDFFNTVETEPDWLDWDRIDRALDVCHRLGKSATYALSVSALLGGYTNNELTKPLTFAGALNGNSTFDRINYTSSFWMEITTPGALKRGEGGYNIALFVRFKHALIRRHILNNPDWRSEDWGVPINTADSAMTNIGFSTVMILGARALGMKVTDEEHEDVLHFWRYIGYLIGDDDMLLPKTKEESVQGLYYAGTSNRHSPEEDAVMLARSFFESLKYTGPNYLQKIKGFFIYWFYRVLAKHLIPSVHHEKLDMPPTYKLELILTPMLFGSNYILESVRTFMPKLEKYYIKLGRYRQLHWLKQRQKRSLTKTSTRGPVKQYEH
jgi:hypothetical protein